MVEQAGCQEVFEKLLLKSRDAQEVEPSEAYGLIPLTIRLWWRAYEKIHINVFSRSNGIGSRWML